MAYKCKICGCEEFVSQPNQYSVFEHREGKLICVSAETIEEELELYCRECSEKLEFNEDDINF